MRAASIAAILVWGYAVPAGAGAEDAKGNCSFTILLPAEARLYCNGTLVKGMGAVRKFVAGDIDIGDSYRYQFRMELDAYGAKIAAEKTVSFSAGQSVTIAFPEIAARKEVENEESGKAIKAIPQRQQEKREPISRGSKGDLRYWRDGPRTLEFLKQYKHTLEKNADELPEEDIQRLRTSLRRVEESLHAVEANSSVFLYEFDKANRRERAEVRGDLPVDALVRKGYKLLRENSVTADAALALKREYENCLAKNNPADYEILLAKISRELENSKAPASVSISAVGGKDPVEMKGLSVKYRFIGRKDSTTTAAKLTPCVVELPPPGCYYIWVEKDGKILSDDTSRYLIDKKLLAVTLRVKGE